MDPGERWYFDELVPACELGELRCVSSRLERCVAVGPRRTYQLEQECADDGLTCAPELGRCVSCLPGTAR
ncbi:MAG TPA: hypothetical protein VFQ61_05740, partial [Polyangiaceae bacterium]|nr:hypothetical protein [Polyangiaceae bacterium]